MSKRITHWGNGVTSRNVFTIRFFGLRLELWKDYGNPFKATPQSKENTDGKHD